MGTKQTAVEWLINNLFQDNFFICTGGIEDEDLVEYIKKAKSMEKEQIKNAFNEGQNNSLDYFIPNNKMSESEQYYEETYGK